jgi:hypothetical protein
MGTMNILDKKWNIATDIGSPEPYTTLFVEYLEEGSGTCDACGFAFHTPEQLAECVDSCLAPVEEDPDECPHRETYSTFVRGDGRTRSHTVISCDNCNVDLLIIENDEF